MSFLRKAHGNGAGALLRAETPPIDEVKPLNADDTEDGLALTQRRGRPFTRGNTAAANRRPALALLGRVDVKDARYRRALRQANAYRQRRCRELAITHGGYLGAAPSAMLASSARALASSTVLDALAGEALAAGHTKEAAALFVQAAGLSDKSRQQELTAVALAAREAEGRLGASALTPHQELNAFLEAEAAERKR